MSLSTPAESSIENSMPVVKACDACRLRKIRCDKKTPCSSCVTLEIVCKRTPQINEHRHQRVLISREYEKKVDRIDERLYNIDESLQRLLQVSHNLNQRPYNRFLSPSETISITEMHRPLNNSVSDLKTVGDSSNAEFEGDTSLMAHSLYAKALFEREISSRDALGKSFRMKAALSALQDTLKSQNDPSEFHNLRFPHTSQDTSETGSKSEMPPLQAVLDVLGSVKEQIPRFFLEFPILEAGAFQELCQRVYFAVEKYPPAVFALVNGGLFYLFMELSASKPPDILLQYRQHASLCRSNFGASLQNFQLLASPTLENCQALIFGAIHAMDISKPSVSVRLTSAAVEMCRSLGYHRLSNTLKTATAKAERRIFWTAYVMDKTFSLRVGRTSILQDCDISTGAQDYPDDPLHVPWHMMYLAWVSLAKLQGQIYDDLFTFHALAESLEVRTQRANVLVADLERWRHECSLIDMNEVYFPEAFRTTFKTTDVAYYATLTTVQRIIPPLSHDSLSVINPQCLESARAALRIHQSLSKYYQSSDEWQTYVTWTLIASPFSPILILFSHTINARSTADLNHLRAFVVSLKPITLVDPSATYPSAATKRLHDLCEAFCRVAEVYLEESAAAGDDNHGSSGSSQPDLLGPVDDNVFWPMDDLLSGDQNMNRLLDVNFWGM